MNIYNHAYIAKKYKKLALNYVKSHLNPLIKRNPKTSIIIINGSSACKFVNIIVNTLVSLLSDLYFFTK